MGRAAAATAAELAVGLMSGTSADGVDAALVAVTPRRGRAPAVTTLAALTVPYGAAFRRRLLALPDVSVRELARLHVELAERFAAATHAVLARARVPAAHPVEAPWHYSV